MRVKIPRVVGKAIFYPHFYPHRRLDGNAAYWTLKNKKAKTGVAFRIIFYFTGSLWTNYGRGRTDYSNNLLIPPIPNFCYLWGFEPIEQTQLSFSPHSDRWKGGKVKRLVLHLTQNMMIVI